MYLIYTCSEVVSTTLVVLNIELKYLNSGGSRELSRGREFPYSYGNFHDCKKYENTLF